MEQIQICFSALNNKVDSLEKKISSFLSGLGLNTRPMTPDSEMEYLTISIIHMPEDLKAKAAEQSIGIIFNITPFGLTIAYVHITDPKVSGTERFFIPFSNIAAFKQVVK